MADKSEIQIYLTGLEETLSALSLYDPDARKQLFNAVRDATQIIRDDARRHIPSAAIPTGWRQQTGMPQGDGAWQKRTLTRGGKGWPPWEPNNVKRLIKSYMGRRRASRWSIITTRGIVVNASGEGVIYEFAKKSHKSAKYPWVNSTPFVRHMGSFAGGRLIWAAAERNKEQVRTEILDAMAVANQRLQSRFDAVKESDR